MAGDVLALMHCAQQPPTVARHDARWYGCADGRAKGDGAARTCPPTPVGPPPGQVRVVAGSVGSIPDTAGLQGGDDVDEVAQVAAETVNLPDEQGVPAA